MEQNEGKDSTLRKHLIFNAALRYLLTCQTEHQSVTHRQKLMDKVAMELLEEQDAPFCPKGGFTGYCNSHGKCRMSFQTNT